LINNKKKERVCFSFFGVNFVLFQKRDVFEITKKKVIIIVVVASRRR
jgi:hypothetical protein